MDKTLEMTLNAHNPVARAIALDLDGVVYAGEAPLPGAVEAANDLRRSGYRLFFVTNNSGKGRAGIARKLCSMGIEARTGEVVNSGYASGALIRRLCGQGAPAVLVLGTGELREEIAGFGLRVVGGLPCEYLVVGLDPCFSYDRIALALDAVSQGAVFIACNRDRSYPVHGGRLMPGCGPLVEAIECAWGRAAHYEAGKPGSLMLEMIAAGNRLAPHEILVVGDSRESDIAMAVDFGSPAVLVEQGGPRPGRAGDWVLTVESLAALRDFLLEGSGRP